MRISRRWQAEPFVSLATNGTGRSDAHERGGLCSGYFGLGAGERGARSRDGSTIRSDAPPHPSADAAQTDDRIEIELGNGRLVRVGSGIDLGALKRILTVLDGR